MRRIRTAWGFAVLVVGLWPLACGSGGGSFETGGTGGGGSGVCAPGTSRACYSGPAATEGVGVCKGGTQPCNADGQSYGPCEGEVLPAAVDDCATDQDENCDGAVNDGCECSPGDTEPCYTGTAGTQDVGPCHGGTRTCGADHAWGACEGEVVPAAEDCSTPDDEDCDGLAFDDTDSGCVCEPDTTEPCDTGIPGVCAPGTHTCDPDGKAYSACAQDVQASFDDCTTPEDEDCDGEALACDGSTLAGGAIFGTGFDDVAFAVAADPSGEIVVGGVTNGTTIGFGVTAGAMQVIRFDAAGVELWNKTFGAGGHAVARGVALDGTGNVYVVGHFAGSIDFGNGIPPFTSNNGGGDTDLVLAKLDPAGDALWAQTFGAAGSPQYGYAIAVDAAGNAVITGGFVSSIDFGAGALASAGGSDVFVAKFDPTGLVVWSKKAGNNADQTGRAIAVTPQGDVVVAGGFGGQIDFGGGPLISAGIGDVFVAELAGADGAPIWARQFGDAQDQVALGVAVDAQGEVAVTGTFRGSIDFGNGAHVNPTNSTGDVFVARLSADGASSPWSQAFGDASDQVANAVAFDGAGHVLVGGHFWGMIDFGGQILVNADPNNATSDAFAAKFEAATGGHLWSRRFGDAGGEQRVRAVATDGKGHSILAGGYSASVDFGPPVGVLTSTGVYDIFAVTLGP
jgi:hypothetical protein